MKPERSAISRRDALKWLAGTSAAGVAAPAMAAPNETGPAPASTVGRHPIHDPDFFKPVFPWEKLLSEEEMKTVTVLADIILPKDELGPSASELKVPEFINEWISAPYEDKVADRELIRGGIAWLNTESFRRFEKRFDEVNATGQIQIVDDICGAGEVKAEHQLGAKFFTLIRKLTLGGYYTHSGSWKQLGYVGNISLGGAYPGVPQEIIELLKLQDVV
ncbi:gluconate 2-dehydrogenase subunit 3 family protein [Phragmitibacter flavus]|uniref:Gluconate 2-dehydrogenase subunit 3 family protein n=1 Tax=Phragmitibacter flavus TaxID=2576071 RepID=A0A5R8KB34_9BACT|nr:gluconate 2-dehydrogenase subunit 3 family protein [Phragmitibacter flavus]TLD68749.1 gluconate 2-dehydrogenase subunit 3 family protein [Phragmitibacter flavus]